MLSMYAPKRASPKEKENDRKNNRLLFSQRFVRLFLLSFFPWSLLLLVIHFLLHFTFVLLILLSPLLINTSHHDWFLRIFIVTYIHSFSLSLFYSFFDVHCTVLPKQKILQCGFFSRYRSSSRVSNSLFAFLTQTKKETKKEKKRFDMPLNFKPKYQPKELRPESEWQSLGGCYGRFFSPSAHPIVEGWYNISSSRAERHELKRLIKDILHFVPDATFETLRKDFHPDVAQANAILNIHGAKLLTREAENKTISWLALTTIVNRDSLRRIFQSIHLFAAQQPPAAPATAGGSSSAVTHSPSRKINPAVSKEVFFPTHVYPEDFKQSKVMWTDTRLGETTKLTPSGNAIATKSVVAPSSHPQGGTASGANTTKRSGGTLNKSSAHQSVLRHSIGEEGVTTKEVRAAQYLVCPSAVQSYPCSFSSPRDPNTTHRQTFLWKTGTVPTAFSQRATERMEAQQRTARKNRQLVAEVTGTQLSASDVEAIALEKRAEEEAKAKAHAPRSATQLMPSPWGLLDTGNVDGAQWRSVTHSTFQDTYFLNDPEKRPHQNFNENFTGLAYELYRNRQESAPDGQTMKNGAPHLSHQQHQPRAMTALEEKHRTMATLLKPQSQQWWQKRLDQPVSSIFPALRV